MTEPNHRLQICKEGFEEALSRELLALSDEELARGPGWVLSRSTSGADARDLCFATQVIDAVEEVTTSSVKKQAAALADAFVRFLGDRSVERAWPLCFLSATGPGLAERRKLVEAHWRELVRRRRARVLRLGEPLRPDQRSPQWGFGVLLVDRDRAYCGGGVHSGGQQRMRLDPSAPSRSYLKLEEAFALLALRPEAGELVIDLGAAPGGWSYSAAQRGARVLAIDNGPLKGGAIESRLIQHQRANAFTFSPPGGRRADWLLCDMIADPGEVLELLGGWLERGWCDRFVVNLKFGHDDPLRLLRRLRDPRRGLAVHARELITRQLFHDRDELTVMGRRGS